MTTKRFLTQFDKIKGEDFSQKFDQNVTFKRKGKKIKIKDFVQENAVGTDFYKNLETFGNIESTINFMNVNRQEIVADFKEAVSLQDLEERRIKTKELFYRLPAGIRDRFGNSFEEFVKNGDKFIAEQEAIIKVGEEFNERQTQMDNKQQVQENQQPTNQTK